MDAVNAAGASGAHSPCLDDGATGMPPVGASVLFPGGGGVSAFTRAIGFPPAFSPPPDGSALAPPGGVVAGVAGPEMSQAVLAVVERERIREEKKVAAAAKRAATSAAKAQARTTRSITGSVFTSTGCSAVLSLPRTRFPPRTGLE